MRNKFPASILAFIWFVFSLGSCGVTAHAQVALSASSIRDSFENPIPLAKFCLVPVNAAMSPSGFRVGSTQVVPNEVCGTVTAGVLQTGLHVAPSPTGFYYHLYLKQSFSNTVLQDYGSAAITGSTWTLDSFDPSVTIPAPSPALGSGSTVPSTCTAPSLWTTGAGVYSCVAGVFVSISAGGSSTTISGLTFTPTDTTIVATWTTSSAADSNLNCAGIAAIDNGVQAGVTTHEAIVTGLVPTSSYSCYVTSAGTSSTPQNVATTGALTRTPIASASLGSATSTSYVGDTLYNFLSSDGNTYLAVDDTTSPGASANMSLLKVTNESSMTMAAVNSLSGYGAQATTNGTDGPGGVALSYKESGLFGMGGCLYMFGNRDHYAVGATPQSVFFGNVIADGCNHGASWSNHQAPATFGANGLPDGAGVSMFADTANQSWCSFVRAAPDDGSLGYNTPGNQIDGLNAYVVMNCTDGNWNNSSHNWQIRTPRATLAALVAGNKWQWWCGPASPTPADYVNPSNWSYASGCRTPTYTAANQVSASDEIFVPGFNYYVMANWYQPVTGTSSTTNWNIVAGPTPAGPWTSIYTNTFNPQAWYNPVFLQRPIAANTSATSVSAPVLFTGDYNSGTYYHPSYATMTLTAGATQTEGVLPTPTTDYGAQYVGISNTPFTSNGHLTSFTIQENTAYSGTLYVGTCSAPSGSGPYNSTIANSVSVTLASTLAPQTFTAPTNFTSFSVTSGQYPCFYVPTGTAGPGKAGTGSIGFYYSGPFTSIPSGSQSYLFVTAGSGGLDITETITIP